MCSDPRRSRVEWLVVVPTGWRTNQFVGVAGWPGISKTATTITLFPDIVQLMPTRTARNQCMPRVFWSPNIQGCHFAESYTGVLHNIRFFKRVYGPGCFVLVDYCGIPQTLVL